MVDLLYLFCSNSFKEEITLGGDTLKWKWIGLLIIVLLLNGCQVVKEIPPSVISVKESAETKSSPFDRYLPIESPAEGTAYLYYRLFSNGTRYWYYPMTGFSNDTLPLHVQALNKTLSSICEALNVAPIGVDTITIRNGIAELNLPDSFTLGLPSLNAVRSVGDALVMTLTEFTSIQKVQFLIDGKSGNFLSRNSAQYEINLPVNRPKWPNEETTKQENKAVVYWRIPQTEYLIPLTIRLQHSDHLSLQALEILLQGPQNYAAAFWPSTLINNGGTQQNLTIQSYTIHENTAYLDLNCDSSIMECSDATSATTLKAIVQTLTEFPEIEKIQFLFRSKRIALVNDPLNLGDPIQRFLMINREP